MKILHHVIIICLFAALDVVAQTGTPYALLNVDRKKLVSRADLLYNKPAARSEEGMPIGNGVMGTLVWTTPSSLHFQLNRVDVFANNSASNNFYERHTDYCNGLGFVDVDFPSNGTGVFESDGFSQHLSCYEGIVTTNGNGITAKAVTWQENDVMALQVEDTRNTALPVQVNLRTLRAPVTKRGDHTAISKLKIDGSRIILIQEFKEGNYYCGSAVAIAVSGRKVSATIENESMVRLSIGAGNGKFSVLMASAASFNSSDDIVALSLQKLEQAQAKSFDGMLQSNQRWWEAFWQKSFVHLHSADGEADFVEKNYTYFLYVMASSSRGKFPVKFNGMLWTTGGDDRKWGNLYWGANQSCLYNALFQTNHLELLDPMFSMYTSAYGNLELAARQQWGSAGVFIPETVAFDGLAPLPDSIAAEMRDLYLLKKPWTQRSQSFNDYAYPKMPFLSRWNWKKDEGWKNGRWYTGDKGGGAFGHVTHIFSRGAKIAYQYWLRYEYTHDEHWLRSSAYPMLKGVAEFYRNFPNVKKEKDGKYHIYHINDNESIWDGHNTVEEISSMMGIFPVAAKAAAILDVDKELQAAWLEFAKNIAPLPMSDSSAGGKSTWIRSLEPVAHGNANRSPDPNTMPVWFFDLCTLESDKSLMETGNRTFDTYFPEGISERTKIYVLSKLPVVGSLLGREESTRFLIPNQLRTAETEVMANRMDLREGFQTTSVQRLGRAAEALQYALCQGVPSAPGEKPVVHIFPAWPKAWDAQYTLRCRGGFLVSASIQDGGIDWVQITSESGNELTIKNPWPGKKVVIYLNGKKWKSEKREKIVVPTHKGDSFLFITQGNEAKLDKMRANIPK